MSVRSSVFVTQFEGESHGNELGALRCGGVEHVAKLGEIAPQAVPDLILNLHDGHGSEVAS